jgi:purine-binding chemotaxis protein CheW
MSAANLARNVRAEMADELDADGDEDSMKDRYLAFRLGDEEYGLEIQFVTEIVGLQKISAVPELPPYVKGVINLRGQVIPVMDVRTRFGMPFQEYGERTCVIVVNVDDYVVGLVVDAVKEVSSLTQESIAEAPRVARSPSAQYVKGIGKSGESVRIILDVNKLLTDADRAAAPGASR